MAGKERTILGKDNILTADDLKTEEVEVEEWGGWMLIRTLTGRERDRLEADLLTGKKNGQVNLDNVRAKMVVATAVDKDGNQLFQRGDEKKLGEKSGAALSKVAVVAQRLAGLSSMDVEELAKNSSSGPAES